jgi:hypothetical protein
MVNNDSSPVPSDDVPAWKKSYTVPLDDDHPSCAHPGDIEHHDDLHRTLDVVRKAYDWCITADGYLAGLVSGDMGWSVTSIRLKPEDIHENMKKLDYQE